MIVIAGHVSIDPAKVDVALPAARTMMEETHKEAGCLAYVFSQDLEEPGRFRIFEEWESQEALDAHFKAPHMATFQQAMGGFGVREMNVTKYEIASKGPLG